MFHQCAYCTYLKQLLKALLQWEQNIYVVYPISSTTETYSKFPRCNRRPAANKRGLVQLSADARAVHLNRGCRAQPEVAQQCGKTNAKWRLTLSIMGKKPQVLSVFSPLARLVHSHRICWKGEKGRRAQQTILHGKRLSRPSLSGQRCGKTDANDFSSNLAT